MSSRGAHFLALLTPLYTHTHTYKRTRAFETHRMLARGADRDRDKYDQLDQLRARWLSEHEAQVAEWDAGCAARGWKPVVRLSTEQPVEHQVRQLLAWITGQ